jgi:uncharacterized protein YcnI
VIPCPTWPRALAVAVVLVALVAAPGRAHPAVRGGELPVDSLATLTLVTGHGCGADHGGAEAPTTEVVLEVPDWLRVVDAPAAAPWTTAVDAADASGTGTVTWTTDAPAVTAPDLDLEVVATGAEGEVRHLRVVQSCGERTERWVGTPDEPADQPAVEVRLAAADPSSPPPPEVEPRAPGTQDAPAEDGAADADGDGGAGGQEADDPAGDDDPGRDDGPATSDAAADAADTAAADAEVSGGSGADLTDLAPTTATAEDEPSGWWLALLLVLAIVPLAVVLGRRRVQADAAANRDGRAGTTTSAAEGAPPPPDGDTPDRP